MQLDVSAEVILSQLGYSRNDASLQQAEKIIETTINQACLYSWDWMRLELIFWITIIILK